MLWHTVYTHQGINGKSLLNGQNQEVVISKQQPQILHNALSQRTFKLYPSDFRAKWCFMASEGPIVEILSNHPWMCLSQDSPPLAHTHWHMSHQHPPEKHIMEFCSMHCGHGMRDNLWTICPERPWNWIIWHTAVYFVPFFGSFVRWNYSYLGHTQLKHITFFASPSVIVQFMCGLLYISTRAYSEIKGLSLQHLPVSTFQVLPVEKRILLTATCCQCSPGQVTYGSSHSQTRKPLYLIPATQIETSLIC